MDKNQHTILITIPTTETIVGAISGYLTKALEVLKEVAAETTSVAQGRVSGLTEEITKRFNKIFQKRRSTVGNENPSSNFSSNFKNNKNYKLIGLGILAVVLMIGAFFIGRSTSRNIAPTYADGRPAAPAIKAQQVLNKDFSFPLVDDKGNKVSTVKYKITTVDLEDSIIVNGQRANAVAGRTFLILNLQITNNHTQGIQINSKDYVRLSSNGSSELIAPDIHNDPVTVQAISTKITRLGFPINDTDKNLKLQVGEIKGTKQVINLEFK